MCRRLSGSLPLRRRQSRAVILPFLFNYNTDLLLIGIGIVEAFTVFIIATIAILLFTAGTQGYFLSRSRVWALMQLILIGFTLFRPCFWMDMVVPPYETMKSAQIYQAAVKARRKQRNAPHRRRSGRCQR